TRCEGARIGEPRSGSRREGDPVPGDGGHACGGTPDLAGDPRIPAGVTQGAAGNVRTGERLPARSVGGPGDAPRAPRDPCECPGPGGQGTGPVGAGDPNRCDGGNPQIQRKPARARARISPRDRKAARGPSTRTRATEGPVRVRVRTRPDRGRSAWPIPRNQGVGDPG